MNPIYHARLADTTSSLYACAFRWLPGSAKETNWSVSWLTAVPVYLFIYPIIHPPIHQSTAELRVLFGLYNNINMVVARTSEVSFLLIFSSFFLFPFFISPTKSFARRYADCINAGFEVIFTNRNKGTNVNFYNRNIFGADFGVICIKISKESLTVGPDFIHPRQIFQDLGYLLVEVLMFCVQ